MNGATLTPRFGVVLVLTALSLAATAITSPAAAADYYVFGAVYAAKERFPEETYPSGSPLESKPASEVVGKNSLTAMFRMMAVKIDVVDARNGDSLGSTTGMQGGYYLQISDNRSSIDVRFEVSAADSREVLLRTDPVTIGPGNNVRHLLVPGDYPGVGRSRGEPENGEGLFTRVGLVEADDINSEGFAEPASWASHLQDAPFGGALRLFGAVKRTYYPDVGMHNYCYKLKVTGPNVSSFITDQLTKTRYLVMQDGEVLSEEVRLGPKTFNTPQGQEVENCYQLTPMSNEPHPDDDPAGARSVFWSFPDLLAHWRTRDLRDGSYQITLSLYRVSNESNESDNDNNDAENVENIDKLKLHLDNTPVDVSFDTLEVVDSTGSTQTDLLQNKCAMADLNSDAGSSRDLNLDFTAAHTSGYLGKYRLLVASNSRNKAFRKQGAYNPTTTPQPSLFKGRTPAESAFTEIQAGNNNNNTKPLAETFGNPCAYQFDLWAIARTTDGYDRINRSHTELFYYVDP